MKGTIRMQRYSLDNENVGNESNSGLNASVFGIFFILLSFVVLVIAILINGFLPEPLNTRDGTAENDKFIAERAYKNLEQLSSIGPKVLGTYENEVLTVKYLLEEVNEIIDTAQKQFNEIVFDLQRVSGCFTLSLKGVTKVSCYENVQNIVVKLKPVTNVPETILLNCHFDSVSTSPGTSDDGLHCAVMLEILRVLSNSKESLKKNVLFLFNGAEEDGLLASHGFVMQHKWADNISCFINLESCGAGGREILFQTGPMASVLPRIYARVVPYPHGTVIGEELFQSGVLPSDTDFRIFRDFGKMKGLDFAHYKNGYVYHTSSDNLSQISENVIQHTGSNILALLNALIEEENLTSAIKENENQAIFFDVFGFFMICYSTMTAFFVNCIALVLSVYTITYISITIFKSTSFKGIGYHFTIDFLFVGIGTFLTLLVLHTLASLLKLYGLSMLWYSNQWFLATYYGVAIVYTNTTLIRLCQTLLPSKLSRENETKLFIIVTQMINTFLLCVGMILRIRSIYLFVVNLIPLTVSHLLLYKTRLNKQSVGRKTIVYVMLNLISSLYAMYLTVQVTHLLVPMMGRFGVDKDSETLMWILCYLTSYLMFSYFVPLVLLVKNWWKIQVSFGMCYALYIIFILYGQVLTPFGDETPERFSVMHVHSKLINQTDGSKVENSGYLVTMMDKRAPQTLDTLFHDTEFKEVGDVCEEKLFCGLPTMYSSFRRSVKSDYWHDAEKPAIPRDKKLDFKIDETGNIRKYYLNFTGPGFGDLYVLPLYDAELIEWSLYPGKLYSELNWGSEKVFMIRRLRGLEVEAQWSCWLKFDVSKMTAQIHAFKLVWSVHHRSNTTAHYTRNFQTFLNRFPSWTRVVSWVAEHEEYLL